MKIRMLCNHRAFLARRIYDVPEILARKFCEQGMAQIEFAVARPGPVETADAERMRVSRPKGARRRVEVEA